MLPRMGSLLISGLLVLLLLVAAERPAYGYVDPGTGALIWQGLIAAAVGVSFRFRRILNWFSRKK